MSVRTRGLLNCPHLLIREHFDARRSDVSQTGLVQANGEVRRPANGSRNKVMIFRKRTEREGLCYNQRATNEERRGTHGGCEERGEAGEWGNQVGTWLGAEGRTRRRGWDWSGCCWRRTTRGKMTPKDRATEDASNHEGCNKWRKEREEDESLRMTAVVNATQVNSQVAFYTIGAPAQMVLKVLAGHASALLEYVARYHVLLLLSVPLCAWSGWWEGRVGGEELRRFGEVRIRRSR